MFEAVLLHDGAPTLSDWIVQCAFGLVAAQGSLANNATLFGMLILSLAIHEFGHSFCATRLGDPTSERLGRLTLNPIPHLDLMYSVLLPAFLIFSGAGVLFGAGKPVPVDTRYLRHPHRDMLLISVAGPAMNVVLALLLTAFAWGLQSSSLGVDGGAARAVHQGIQLNLLLAVFNMLPVPPLDGHRVLGFFLPDAVRERFYRMQWLGLVLLLFLLMGPGHSILWDSTLRPLSRAWQHLMMPEHWPYRFF